jgi:hypothetical protein
MPQIKANALQPGDVLDQWDLEPGPGSIIAEVRVIPRPGFKYQTVRIRFQDGAGLGPLAEITKLNVIARGGKDPRRPTIES